MFRHSDNEVSLCLAGSLADWVSTEIGEGDVATRLTGLAIRAGSSGGNKKTMTPDPSTLDGTALNRLAAESQGGIESRELRGHWNMPDGSFLYTGPGRKWHESVTNYTPATDRGQAMELLESLSAG